MLHRENDKYLTVKNFLLKNKKSVPTEWDYEVANEDEDFTKAML